MSQPYPRHIHFESVPNFRDLGGYRTHDGRTVAWRRLFRSAALHKMNDREVARLKQEVSPRTVIDLRSPKDPEKTVRLLEEVGARYCPIPFSTWPWPGDSTATPNATHMGEIYLYRISEKPFGERLVDALEIIADRDNHPLIFHCSAFAGRSAEKCLAERGLRRRMPASVLDCRPHHTSSRSRAWLT